MNLHGYYNAIDHHGETYEFKLINRIDTESDAGVLQRWTTDNEMVPVISIWVDDMSMSIPDPDYTRMILEDHAIPYNAKQLRIMELRAYISITQEALAASIDRDEHTMLLDDEDRFCTELQILRSNNDQS
jgi:hypothetical protein